MGYKIIFIIIILTFLIVIYISTNGKETFNTNLFFKPIPNVFLTDNYLNYETNKPDLKTNTKSLGEITFNSYLYSKPIEKKIICSSHKNRADCWEDNVNNCQWIHKIDGGLSEPHKNSQGNFIRGSYCDVGQNIWP